MTAAARTNLSGQAATLRLAPGATPAPSNDPFFIIGVHRSGTTLLRYMLSSSPRIHVPPESDFIPRFFAGRPDTPVTRERAGKILSALFTQHQYRLFAREWCDDRPTVDQLLGRESACSPGQFLDRLFTIYAAGYDAARWGDKTPIYTNYMPLLHSMLPHAKFVHTIRDGRDVARSMVEKWGKREPHVDLYWAIQTWARRLRAARLAGQHLGPERYLEVRYEAIATDPEPHLKRICAFLGEPYDPRMTQPQQTAKQWIEKDNPFHNRLHAAPNPDHCLRWTKEMPEADQRLCLHVAGDLLKDLGYPTPDAGELTRSDRRRIALLKTKYTLSRLARNALTWTRLRPPN